jgi:hypothetical protein
MTRIWGPNPRTEEEWTARHLRRLFEKVAVTDGCWFYTGQISYKGYGVFSVRSVKRPAHVVMYELLVGPVPAGLQVDHLCFVRHCVNPDHLEPVTAAENMRRMSARQTACRKAGHDYGDPRNVYVRKNGRRCCKECRRIAVRIRRTAAIA